MPNEEIPSKIVPSLGPNTDLALASTLQAMASPDSHASICLFLLGRLLTLPDLQDPSLTAANFCTPNEKPIYARRLLLEARHPN